MNPTPDDGIIRISKDDALDPHVDDMLKRQMSLRGEGGVTRDQGRQWHYQNWFVFMLVGMLGAVGAWAILEPSLEDMLYYQGKITSVEKSSKLIKSLKEAGAEIPFEGSVKIGEQEIILYKNMKELLPDGKTKKFDTESLEVGETVGFWVEYESGPEDNIAIAVYVVRDPPPQKPAQAKKTLKDMSNRSRAAGFVFFALAAGMIGLFIGAADGLICRLPRRALMCGLVGLIVGLVGGFLTGIFANFLYSPISQFASSQSGGGAAGMSTLGFTIQLFGRSIAWGFTGMAMGLGQGLALRSMRLLLYGLIGGVVGGLLGGLFFDPVDMILLNPDKPSAHVSRLVGLAMIGLSVGGLIGIVELLARDAWLRMTQGPLTGKEFLIFKDVMNVGSSPRSDIYLFNDPLVADNHAVLRARGDACEIEARQKNQPILVNDRSVTHARLRHGDTVTIGRTVFVFQQRKT